MGGGGGVCFVVKIKGGTAWRWKLGEVISCSNCNTGLGRGGGGASSITHVQIVVVYVVIEVICEGGEVKHSFICLFTAAV